MCWSMLIMPRQPHSLYVKVVETLSWTGIILPKKIDQSALPGYGCLYTISKLYSILTPLLDIGMKIKGKQEVIT